MYSRSIYVSIIGVALAIAILATPAWAQDDESSNSYYDPQTGGFVYVPPGQSPDTTYIPDGNYPVPLSDYNGGMPYRPIPDSDGSTSDYPNYDSGSNYDSGDGGAVQ